MNVSEYIKKLIAQAWYQKSCIVLGVGMIFVAVKRFDEQLYLNGIFDLIVAVSIIVNNYFRLKSQDKPLSQTVNYLKLDK